MNKVIISFLVSFSLLSMLLIAIPSPTVALPALVTSPTLIASYYNETGLFAAGHNGANVTIAIIDPYAGAESATNLSIDFTDFSNNFGVVGGSLAFAYPFMSGDYNHSNINVGWGPEDALDTQAAHSAAPGARILMVFSPTANGSDLANAISWTAAHTNASVISMSWQEPESLAWTSGDMTALNASFTAAAAAHVTLLAAAGDCGAYDNTNSTTVAYPAESVLVTAVGGTSLHGYGSTVTTEGAWNGTGAYPCANSGGGGGGESSFILPAWQTVNNRILTNRALPDVSAVATPGLPIYVGGVAGGDWGGTSLATPLWAGFVATIDSKLGHSIGFMNPALYNILNSPTEYARDFTDVTYGNNGYNASVCWDFATGIGTPNVGALADTLNNTASGGSGCAIGGGGGSPPPASSITTVIELGAVGLVVALILVGVTQNRRAWR